jgi:hypothetical protein
MKITTVTWSNPALAPRAPTRTLIDREPGNDTAVVQLSSAKPPAASAGAIETLEKGHLGMLVAAGSKAKVADEGVTFLLEQINSATPAQIGSFMVRNHLASTPAAAQSHAETMLAAAHSKEGGSILLGVRAGVATFVVVDSIKPEWSLARKITIAVAVAALLSAALIFGVREKPDQPAAKPVSSSASLSRGD